jgi:hypothetical protein
MIVRTTLCGSHCGEHLRKLSDTSSFETFLKATQINAATAATTAAAAAMLAMTSFSLASTGITYHVRIFIVSIVTELGASSTTTTEETSESTTEAAAIISVIISSSSSQTHACRLLKEG